ncbi:MAG: hypothetical protein U9O20_01810 [Patescibacteria group bacterium]|nr:hypothetical protein [Patescibacteria group bacterium]
MNKLKLNIFEIGALFLTLQAIGALVFALIGLFFTVSILLWFFATLGLITFMLKRKIILIEKISRKEIILLSALCLFALLLSFFTTPTIFGGRDEGSFSSAAIMLSQNGSLEYSSALEKEFFDIYGPGKALNFPGFMYTQKGQLCSQFLPGYISWVGLWHNLFGLTGLKIANFFPFIIFLFSFFLVLKHFVTKKKYAFIGTLLLATTFPMVVFFKFTLTEIFFASLLWMFLHFTLKYFRNKSFENFIPLLIPLVPMSFVRIEALGIIFAFILVFITFDFANAKTPRFQSLLTLLGLAVATSLLVSPHFFVDSFKNLFELAVPVGNSTKEISDESLIPDDWQGFYLVKVFFNYNILPLVIMGGAMMIMLFRKRTWDKLLVLFLLSPILIYLVDANISLDHPWMLRRFLFAILPLFFLYSIILLDKTSTKYPKLVMSILVVSFALNSLQSVPFVFDSQNKGLLEQTIDLTQDFKPNDLILVSRQASGSGWSLLAEPMRNVRDLQAVYLFNSNDLVEVNLEKFDSVYLIASEKEIDQAQEKIYASLQKKKIGTYQIKNNIIKPSRDPLSTPAMNKYETQGYIFQIEK